MSTITIEIKDLKDRNLLLHLVQRLGLKIIKEEVQSESELDYHKKIIDAGGEMTDEELNLFLKTIEEERAERELPKL